MPSAVIVQFIGRIWREYPGFISEFTVFAGDLI
jgi:hypothetical protein